MLALFKEGWTYEKYIVLSDSLSRIRIALYKRAIFLASFFSTACIWSFHAICSSSITPKKFIEDFLSKLLLEMWRSASFRGMLSLTDFLWKKIFFFNFIIFRFYLVLLIFNDSLNQPPNFLQSVTKYLRLTLVFMEGRALREGFNCYFSESFCYYWQNFYFCGETGH